MTPQERQLIDDLFARLSKLEGAPRDPDATAAITQGLRSAPNAVYALVQTVLVQDEALRQAHNRIEELEGATTSQQAPGGSFLGSMRDAIFGQDPLRLIGFDGYGNSPGREFVGSSDHARNSGSSGYSRAVP